MSSDIIQETMSFNSGNKGLLVCSSLIPTISKYEFAPSPCPSPRVLPQEGEGKETSRNVGGGMRPTRAPLDQSPSLKVSSLFREGRGGLLVACPSQHSPFGKTDGVAGPLSAGRKAPRAER